MAAPGYYPALGYTPGQQQQPLAPANWSPWTGSGWDQQSLVNSFNTLALPPPPTATQDWVADSSASHHSTPTAGNISHPRTLTSSSPSSIVVGNGSTLPITSVGDSVLPEPFYLNNILLAPDLVQSLLFVRCFTTDNWCSMEFDPFGLSVKDLTTRNVIVRSNSTDPLYTMRLPNSFTSPSTAVTADAIVTPTTWHRRLGHPGPDMLSSLSRSSFINYKSSPHELCHACQLAKHTRLPFTSSMHRVDKPFNLVHLDLWTSPIVSVLGYKYYLVILDDCTHYLWTFSLKLKSDIFTTLSNFFAYVSTQFDCTVKAIQCDNGREFDNSSTRTFLLTKGALLRMSCPGCPVRTPHPRMVKPREWHASSTVYTRRTAPIATTAPEPAPAPMLAPPPLPRRPPGSEATVCLSRRP
jgi:hypothetical protein